MNNLSFQMILDAIYDVKKDLKDKLSDLKKEVFDLKKKVSDLKKEVSDLKKEVQCCIKICEESYNMNKNKNDSEVSFLMKYDVIAEQSKLHNDGIFHLISQDYHSCELEDVISKMDILSSIENIDIDEQFEYKIKNIDNLFQVKKVNDETYRIIHIL